MYPIGVNKEAIAAYAHDFDRVLKERESLEHRAFVDSTKMRLWLCLSRQLFVTGFSRLRTTLGRRRNLRGSS